MKPAKKYQTLRGLWTDTRDGTVYNGSLRAAMLRAGFTVPEYNRSVRALRGLGGWPARVTIRPAHVTEVADAKRTLTWEVEAVFTNRNDVGAVEELVLGNGGWLRRIEVEARRSKHSRSKAYTYRALWLISGLVSVEFLRRIVEPRAGRIVEVDGGSYKVGLEKWQSEEMDEGRYKVRVKR